MFRLPLGPHTWLFWLVALSATLSPHAFAQSDEPPTVPAEIVAQAYSDTAGGIRWHRSTDDRGLVRGYEVERDGVVLGVFDALSYIDTSLSAGTAYHYRVVAIDNAGQRSAATSVTLLTQGEGPDSSVGPAVPTGLRAEVYSHTAAELFWTRPATFGLRYEISRDGVVLATIDGVSYFDDTLSADTNYAYSVVAIDQDGRRSMPSEVAVVTDGSGGDGPPPVEPGPDMPAGLRGEVYSQTAIELLWERSDMLGLRYEVSRDGAVVAVVDGISYYDDSLSPGTTYLYAVVALDARGRRSVPSEQVLTTPVGIGPAPPPDVPDEGDVCPEADASMPIDTDGDGIDNACDPDDDGDGFNDGDDPAPLDASMPGDFSTPESILSDARVLEALEAAEARGVIIRTEMGQTPPDLTGYYRKADATGRLSASGSGFGVGRAITGAESRIDQGDDDLFDSAGIFFTSGRPLGFSIETGSVIRGEGDRYTTYSRRRTTCNEAGSDYDIFAVGITSAELQPSTGDIVNRIGISVTVDTIGTLTAACANRLIDGRASVGGWAVTEWPLSQRVEASSMIYMCVDDDAAYAPTETWISDDGSRCTCTESYETSCE